MTSINKCNGSEIEKSETLTKFFTDCGKLEEDVRNKKNYKWWLSQFFSMSQKHDGLALSCIYEEGELKKVGLRSKSGVDGIDVTNKAKYIKGIPQTLPLPLTMTIRGEVETPISVFNRISEELGDDSKANPRAHTAGSMNHKNPEKMKNRGLEFIAYNILN